MRAIHKVRQVGDTIVITIPKDMAKEIGLVKGDRVMLSTEHGSPLRYTYPVDTARVVMTKEE